MKTVADLRVHIYADGANKADMIRLNSESYIKGLTTNPTLMRQAGITDYEVFAKDILKEISTKPLSLEVFADDFETMEVQALKIHSWGPNVFVKIPVSNTKGDMSYGLIQRLTAQGVKLNITAVFTLEQTIEIVRALSGTPGAVVSIFAGRIADTGRDPIPLMKDAAKVCHAVPKVNLLWASPRELLNIFQADEIGTDIITVTSDILSKLKNVGKSLDQFSLETVKMFYNDARSAGYSI